MQQLVLEHWSFHSPKMTRQIVVPDGCRDLIFLTDRNGQQQMKITEIRHLCLWRGKRCRDRL